MNREDIYKFCLQALKQNSCLLLESATGTGKTRLSIMLANYLIEHRMQDYVGDINVLIFVAKRVHKQTWAGEITKWGGIKLPLENHKDCPGSVIIHMECYESMHKLANKFFDIIILDEVHHVQSDKRLTYLSYIPARFRIGLSATIPKALKLYFKYEYHAPTISCTLTTAINNNLLPEPTIVLYKLKLDNTQKTEQWEINPKAKGKIYYGDIKDKWKYKKLQMHAMLACTQKEKVQEMDSLIAWEKNRYVTTRNGALKQIWLQHAGKRLEYLSDIKLPIIKAILKHLSRKRTVTFCKTIEQAKKCSKNCIHSKNADSEKVYKNFNDKKINHLSAVNILNENANLVDCQYGIFCNFSSSDISVPQRIGRLLRHKTPTIILPYYGGTREEELVQNYIKGFKQVKVINSIQEI